METNFATLNSNRLADLSVGFCLFNGILSPDADLIKALSLAVMFNVNKWYEDNGRTLNAAAELIEEEAIAFAFAKVQGIAFAAQAAAAAEL